MGSAAKICNVYGRILSWLNSCIRTVWDYIVVPLITLLPLSRSSKSAPTGSA